MKKLVERVITAVFIIAMMMGLMTITAFAEDRDYSDTNSSVTDVSEWKYEILDDQSVAIKKYLGESAEIVIPSEIDGYAVKSIAYHAFYNRTSLSSVTIPASVTEIGSSAFENCTSLRSITIPESVTEIGSFAFSGCTSLSSITIPESVTEIGSYAFYNCTSLRSITIPESVTEIGSSAFSGCTSLSSITIPTSVTEIGHNAFSGCTSLSNITIPTSVTTIGMNAFKGTKWLDNKLSVSPYAVINGILIGIVNLDDNIIIPEGVTKISDGVLPSTIKSICLPNSFKTIEKGFLDRYTSLESIIISAGVENINIKDWEALGNCSVFTGCTSLKNITVDSDNKNFASYDGCLYNKDKTILIRCPEGKDTVTLHSEVNEIKDGAFCYCDKLTSILFPEGVKQLGCGTLYGCSELTTITVADDFEKIEGNTFGKCYKFTTINLSGNSNSNIIYNGCMYNKDKTKLILAPVAKSDVSLEEGLEVIGSGALAYNQTQTLITIPKTVKKIESYGCIWSRAHLKFEGEIPDGEKASFGCAEITFIPSPKWNEIIIGFDGSYLAGEFEFVYNWGAYGIGEVMWSDRMHFTGLFRAVDDELYFFNDAKLDKSFNGIAAYGDKYYVVEAGKVVSEFTGSWISDSRGWKYQNADGTFAKNCWKAVNSKWYYFDGEGYMQTGWKQINGSWYYLESSGAMVTGWLNDGGKWYYIESTGKMAANKWVGSVYYMKANGTMAVSEWVDGGKYYVDSNGQWVPNKTKASWKKDAKGWWYDNGDGTYPKNTWKSIDGSWYYFNNSGYMATGWLNDGRKWYYLESSGRMASSKWIGGTYYVKANGVMATNEWVDNGRYYVDANGKWVTNKAA